MTEQQIPTSEQLNRAADILERRGWQQGGGWHDLSTHTGPLCIQGAFAVVMGVDSGIGYRCAGMLAVMDYLGLRMGLFSWNDMPGRTAAEVVEVLRACAVIEASRERESVEVSA